MPTALARAGRRRASSRAETLRTLPFKLARVEFAPEVVEDFERFIEHQAQFGVEDSGVRLAEVVDAMRVLAHSPLIGRKVEGGKRELVIGHGSRGYVALYRWIRDADIVFVLALRSQRESGYRRDA